MEGRRIGWQTSGGASVAGASAGAYDHGLAAGNGDECRLALEEWRRAVRADGKGWRADNPGTGLSATFDRRGMEVRPEGDDWRWGLELLSYGVGGEQ
ncbi:MAG: hypothetical protein EBZ36_15005, partial [Acidobacteria bacterium]|nr:hypothetical protein [Acidobacteriota bacterium]